MAELPLDLLRRGERRRAAYATDPLATRGRFHAEDEDPLRSPFQRDRDRIIHSNAFRRLKHKTQVFVRHEGDHYRTRLTHSLEVAQVARSLARPLGLDEDLAEALALAHDLGHPPFGHAGERALNNALAAHGGFDHNAQSLRVVTELERRYPRFDGLNLSFETLEGLAKHNGPLIGAQAEREPLAWAVTAFPQHAALDLSLFAGLEAQVAAVSDDIAYDCHDLEDGLRAGLIALDELREVALTAPILAAINGEYPQLDAARRVHELIRRLISLLIFDVLGETARRIEAADVASADDVRRAGRDLAGFSAGLGEAEAALKRFLFARLYRSDAVLVPVRQAERLVLDLFEAYSAEPGRMPDGWGRDLAESDVDAGARRIGDYIAGMTDRYAVSEHRRLFDATPDLG
jgi:dGTPase